MGIVEDIRSRVKVDENGCWIWQGRTDRDGYGLIWRDAKRYRVHRVMCAVAHGPIPANLNACHACDVPSCCNPDHLWPGTNRDNAIDAMQKGRVAHGERHGMSRMTSSGVLLASQRLAQGESQVSIARSMGVSPGALNLALQGKTWRRANRDDITLPGKGIKGSKHYLAKLNECDVRNIRELKAQGVTGRAIASLFGVSPASVTNICKRKSWSHVE